MPDEAASPSRPRSIVVVGDLVEGWPPHDLSSDELTERASAEAADDGPPAAKETWRREDVAVVGGYLERLPLACVRAGLVDRAEIWHHARSRDLPQPRHEAPWLTRRVFRLDEERAPFSSAHMLAHLQRFGAPEILVVLGLGVDERILEACRGSLRVYNSIDAPSLRVPPEVSRHFDLVLTGAEWQSEEVRSRHPGMACVVMPIGPEFADPETFRPLGSPKRHDVVYVAAAQPYKRHDLLFDALANAPRPLSALCVCGYGEMGEALRREAAERGLDVTFVGPPGVPFAEVNALMNEARIGIVCGVDDGAPAILTEYMLAGLPVLANERLACGLQYILPETGRAVPAARFGEVLAEMLDDSRAADPRRSVLERWCWPHTVGRLAAALAPLRAVVASRNRT